MASAPESTVDPPRSIGLVLGAGGAPGWAWMVGALAAVEEATGWRAGSADLIVGTSAGSGIAALLRGGVSGIDQLRAYRGEPLSDAGERVTAAALARQAVRVEDDSAPTEPSWRDRLPPNPLLAVIGLARWPPRLGLALAGLVPPGTEDHDDLAARMASFHPAGWPAAPTWLCGVRQADGKRVVFGRDASPRTDIGSAVRASATVPGVYESVEIDGVRYVDGGVWSTTNADLTAGIGLETVLVLAPASVADSGLERSAWALTRAYHRRVLSKEAAAVRRNGSEVIVLEPRRNEIESLTGRNLDRERRRQIAQDSHRLMGERLNARLTSPVLGEHTLSAALSVAVSGCAP